MPGGDKEGSEGALLLLAAPSSHPPAPLGSHWSPSGHDGFMHGHGRPIYWSQAIPSSSAHGGPLMCRGAGEGLSFWGWTAGEMRVGPGFLVQCILEFI